MATKAKKVPAKKKAPTKAQLRVQICKDVLRQLDTKRIIANRGSYLESAGSRWEAQFYNDRDGKVRPPAKKCRVCAIGSVFVCALDRYNELKLSDSGYGKPDSDDMMRYLGRWFGDGQLRLMEQAFEGKNIRLGNQADPKPRAFFEKHGNPKATPWGYEEADSDKLMRAIMANVIANKGTFKP